MITNAVESATNRAEPRVVPLGEPVSVVDGRHQLHELMTALAARDSFIGVLGHELRNAVAPMLLLAEQFAALADDPAAPPLVVSRVAKLIRNLNKLVATVDRIAEVADLRRGTLRLDRSRVDLVEVVGEVCLEARREATAGGTELVIDATGAVTGHWDRTRIKQIVANLVSNAIRYGGGGRVEIRVRDLGDAGELVVQDHGPGIDLAALPRLFDRFEYERSGRGGGFGIGLWLVKTLCTAMQGTVTATNDSSGGAAFCVALPRG